MPPEMYPGQTPDVPFVTICGHRSSLFRMNCQSSNGKSEDAYRLNRHHNESKTNMTRETGKKKGYGSGPYQKTVTLEFHILVDDTTSVTHKHVYQVAFLARGSANSEKDATTQYFQLVTVRIAIGTLMLGTVRGTTFRCPIVRSSTYTAE